MSSIIYYIFKRLTVFFFFFTFSSFLFMNDYCHVKCVSYTYIYLLYNKHIMNRVYIYLHLYISRDLYLKISVSDDLND